MMKMMIILECIGRYSKKEQVSPSPKVETASKPQRTININLDDLDDDSESLGSSDDEDLLDESDDDSMSGGSIAIVIVMKKKNYVNLSHIKLKGQRLYEMV